MCTWTGVCPGLCVFGCLLCEAHYVQLEDAGNKLCTITSHRLAIKEWRG